MASNERELGCQWSLNDPGEALSATLASVSGNLARLEARTHDQFEALEMRIESLHSQLAEEAVCRCNFVEHGKHLEAELQSTKQEVTHCGDMLATHAENLSSVSTGVNELERVVMAHDEKANVRSRNMESQCQQMKGELTNFANMLGRHCKSVNDVVVRLTDFEQRQDRDALNSRFDELAMQHQAHKEDLDKAISAAEAESAHLHKAIEDSEMQMSNSVSELRAQLYETASSIRRASAEVSMQSWTQDPFNIHECRRQIDQLSTDSAAAQRKVAEEVQRRLADASCDMQEPLALQLREARSALAELLSAWQSSILALQNTCKSLKLQAFGPCSNNEPLGRSLDVFCPRVCKESNFRPEPRQSLAGGGSRHRTPSPQRSRQTIVRSSSLSNLAHKRFEMYSSSGSLGTPVSAAKAVRQRRQQRRPEQQIWIAQVPPSWA